MSGGEKTIGVLGGMGHLATVDFYAKLVRLTPAHADRDHLRVIIDSNPKIPDRTAGLTGEGPDPTPALVATARGLERAGADLIAIPCNSAHAYLPAIRSAGVGSGPSPVSPAVRSGILVLLSMITRR